MTTANWLQLLGTIVVLAVTWGQVQSRLKQVEKQTENTAIEVGKSRAGQGARIGSVEERLAHLEGSLEGPRRRTQTRGVPIVADDDS